MNPFKRFLHWVLDKILGDYISTRNYVPLQINQAEAKEEAPKKSKKELKAEVKEKQKEAKKIVNDVLKGKNVPVPEPLKMDGQVSINGQLMLVRNVCLDYEKMSACYDPQQLKAVTDRVKGRKKVVLVKEEFDKLVNTAAKVGDINEREKILNLRSSQLSSKESHVDMYMSNMRDYERKLDIREKDIEARESMFIVPQQKKRDDLSL